MTTDPHHIIRKRQTKSPVDVRAIARELGLEVYADDKLPDHISGMINKDDEGYFVVVNFHHHPNRQRFTVAHEIAHFVLHRDAIGNGITDNRLFRSHLSSSLEKQANQLAADILMPWDLISELIECEPDASAQWLAQKLRVSMSALAIRLGIPLEDD